MPSEHAPDAIVQQRETSGGESVYKEADVRCETIKTMRCAALMLVVCAAIGVAQTAEDPEVGRAQVELDRIRVLVQTGALPRGQLLKAEEALADANDSATIRKSIFRITLNKNHNW